MLDIARAHRALGVLPGRLSLRLLERLGGLYVPHAARMGFRIEQLDERSIEVSMPDKRANRNHLRSLHAMALAHLAEYTTGLLTVYAVVPLGYRSILREFKIEYLAKGRGRVVGRAAIKLPRGNLDKKDLAVKVDIVDRTGQVVARAVSTWRIGKIPGAKSNGRA